MHLTHGDCAGEYRPFPEKPGRNARQQNLEIPLLVRLLGIGRHGRILEVGCGAGVALPILHRLCAPERLVGVDIDRSALLHAAERTRALRPAVELIGADVRALPLEDESFDVVLDFGTCYHIAHGDVAAGEIERVLKPGGVFATETRLNQLLSHPIRSRSRTLHLTPTISCWPRRQRVLWLSLQKPAEEKN